MPNLNVKEEDIVLWNLVMEGLNVIKSEPPDWDSLHAIIIEIIPWRGSYTRNTKYLPRGRVLLQSGSWPMSAQVHAIEKYEPGLQTLEESLANEIGKKKK